MRGRSLEAVSTGELDGGHVLTCFPAMLVRCDELLYLRFLQRGEEAWVHTRFTSPLWEQGMHTCILTQCLECSRANFGEMGCVYVLRFSHIIGGGGRWVCNACGLLQARCDFGLTPW